ncbi:MAG: hypothetical protein HYY25_12710 [Candidatus Wallbacteria bacterium]|nr:hypothetical protein [Candidatus Wallbacteria bacterium]MBI4866011.1 hypothetical protein [Candidatus Wallbacteria bacterium]
MGKSPIHRTATRLAQALKDLDIPFAIAGALAANIHGYHRTTADVDVLLTAEGLRRFKERWLGRGWVEVFPGSKAIRDTQDNVKIDILLTGGYPGDGKPKPVAFPDPARASEASADGMPVLPLTVLLELKLASGMTAPHRPRDLDDVIQLIRANALGLDYAQRLDPYVQGKYRELWDAAQINEDY